MQRSDEIGDLASTFDNMLLELGEAKRRHIDQSFKAGMAEVAAGVLHNVRNSLMPIFNNVEMAQDSSTHCANENIGRSIDELLSGNPPADRREKLLRYLNIAYEHASDERSAVSASLDYAKHQLDQVVEILREQERYSHAKPVLEKVNLGEVIGEARNMIPDSGDLDVSIDIDDAVEKYDARAHRVGLFQIFGNILLNAYESIRRSGRNEGEISVNASAERLGAETEIHITIRDSGAGIDDAALDHVFNRGYTSKDGDRGGLGLHWSANALAGMQGRISVASDGPDRGAEFRVTLSAA